MQLKSKQGNLVKKIALIVLLGLLLRSIWLFAALERDEGSFGYFGWLVANDMISPQNITDNKPLLHHYIYALSVSLFGNTILPMRLLNNLLFLLSIPFYFRLLHMSLDGRTAFLGSILYVIGMNIPAYEGQLAMTSSLAVPVLVMSVYCLVKSHFESRKLFVALSLMLAIVATLFRQTMAIGIIIVFTDVIYTARSEGRLANLRKAVLILCILLGAIVIISLGISMLGWFFETKFFQIISVRIAMILVTLKYMMKLHYIGPVSLIFLEGLFLLVFTIPGVIFFQRLLRKGNGPLHTIHLLLLLWLLLSVAVSILPPMLGYYIIQVIPAISFMAALGFINIWDKTRNMRARRILFLALACSLALISCNFQAYHFPHMNSQRIVEGWNWEYSDMRSLKEQKAVAELVRTSTDDDEMVLVWDQHSLVINFLSERETPPMALNQCPEREYTPLFFSGYIPAPSASLDQEMEYFLDLTLGSPRNLSIPLVQYNRTNHEAYLLDGQAEKVGAIIIPPRHQRMCEGFDKPIFSDLVEEWDEVHLSGAIIYIRPDRHPQKHV